MTSKIILLCTGGTGGHVFPAIALAEELKARGYECVFTVDKRVTQYLYDQPFKVHVIQAATFKKGLWAKLKAVMKILQGAYSSYKILLTLRPQAVIGFGGYPSFPPVYMAQWLKIPTILHEQNTVLGRAHRALVAKATRLALSFEQTKNVTPAMQEKVRVTGNPMRRKLRETVTPYQPAHVNQVFHVLSFGGSQGSAIFAKILPQGIALLDASLRQRLVVTQQCRPEDRDDVAGLYKAAGVTAHLETFFNDMPSLYSQTHLIVARAGASTVAEVSALGRPAIYVPLAASLDGDQAGNARLAENAGGAVLIEEKAFTAEGLAAMLTDMMTHPQRLADMAAAAKAIGRPKAAHDLADLVEAELRSSQ